MPKYILGIMRAKCIIGPERARIDCFIATICYSRQAHTVASKLVFCEPGDVITYLCTQELHDLCLNISLELFSIMRAM